MNNEEQCDGYIISNYVKNVFVESKTLIHKPYKYLYML